jgi:hypothetical protein
MHAHVQRLVSVVKMANVPTASTTEKQRSVVRLLWTKRLNAKDTDKAVFHAYSRKCLSCKAIHNWVNKFSQGHSKVTDDTWPDHSVETATEATVKWLEEMISSDRRIMIKQCSNCTTVFPWFSIQRHLKFWKVCTKWVSRELTDWEKLNDTNGSVLATLLTVCRI